VAVREDDGPHSARYLVQGKVPDEDGFWAFVAHIREHGFEAYWRTYRNVYLELDGWRYWAMPGRAIARSRSSTASGCRASRSGGGALLVRIGLLDELAAGLVGVQDGLIAGAELRPIRVLGGELEQVRRGGVHAKLEDVGTVVVAREFMP
jgi:hypothetical protein